MNTITIDEITFNVKELSKQGAISSIYEILDGKYKGKILKVGKLQNEIRILDLLEKTINCHQYILYGKEVTNYMDDDFEEYNSKYGGTYTDDDNSLGNTYTNDDTMAIIFNKYDMDLEEYIKIKQRISNEDLNIVYNSILNAIECLINAGIRHCDIKPENILVNLDNNNNIKECVLTDFGLGIIDSDYNNDYKEIEKQLIKRGTSIYFSPSISENCNNDKWALGCVLVQMITKFNLPLYEGNIYTNIIIVKQYPTIPRFDYLSKIAKFFNYYIKTNETILKPRVLRILIKDKELFYNQKIIPLFTQCLK